MSKTVLVLCTLDSGTTVTTTFGFTALTILGGSAKAIRTTTPGLGIAIHYNGKIVSPSDSFTETFISGLPISTLSSRQCVTQRCPLRISPPEALPPVQ